ncbi:MAG TPA: hypothetical protein VL635_20805 [Trinickia sp.]|nr:hypothetical protein [Trinickia sp.]
MNLAKMTKPGEKPVQPAVQGATPADGDNQLYQGQKIALTVKTKDLQTANYEQIAFQIALDDLFNPIHDEVTGLLVHPDSVSNSSQSISADTDYTLNAVVFGTASTTDIGQCRWNVKVTGTGLPDLTLNGTYLTPSTDYGYGTSSVMTTKLYGIKAIPGNTSTFDENAAIKISDYQVFKDDASSTAITGVQFSACVGSKSGDLTNFDFWDANQAPIPKIKDDNGKDTWAWIDSDQNGKFTFYVTSNLSSGMYSDTLTIAIGDSNQDIADVIVGDPKSGEVSSWLSAPTADDAVGGTLKLDSSVSYVIASVPRLLVANTVQRGDILFPIVLAGAKNPTIKVLYNAFFVANHNGFASGFPSCFSIPVDAFTGASDNTYGLQYMVVRGTTVVLSSTWSCEVDGEGSNNIPPFDGSPKFPLPVMVGIADNQEINFNMVENGVKVKISWEQSAWQPEVGEWFILNIGINGTDISNNEVHSRQTVPLPAITQSDLDVKLQTIDVEYKYFAAIIKGKSASTMFLQYEVKHDNTHSKGFSKYVTHDINTVPPGGL